MDLHILKEKAAQIGKKYGYLLIVPVIGILFMTLPQKTETEPVSPVSITQPQTERSVQEQLEEILGHVAGAGRVKVMLTVEEGARTRYQTDSEIGKSTRLNSSHAL